MSSTAQMSMARQVMQATSNLSETQRQLFDKIFRKGNAKESILISPELHAEYQSMLRALKATCGRGG